MSLTAAVGSLPSTVPSTGTAHRHHHDFDSTLRRAGQAVAQTGSGSGQLLSNDLLQQISSITGQAPAASALTG
ncbi:MAG: hypothetical protein ACP5NP_13410 [Acetobacteraceae bacterium]